MSTSSVTAAPLAGLEEKIEQLREIGNEFYRRSWSLGTSSNYSVVVERDPVEFIITASGKDKGNLSTTDFVRVGTNGLPTSPDQPQSSAETMLHCVLAKQESVGAVLHTHSVWATLLSDLFSGDGGFWIEDYEMLKGLSGVTTHQHREWVAIYDNTQDITSLSQQVENDFQANKLSHGFLMRQHGLYTWGVDLAEAKRHIEIFEFLFECVARKISLNPRS